jgi:hypothetical protein
LTGRCSTGENFNGIMNDLSVQEPFCDPVYEGNCGYAQCVVVLPGNVRTKGGV